jgi:hypothetical protein
MAINRVIFAFASELHLTPLIPLSKQQGKTVFISEYVWRGGEILRGGYAPSPYYYSPLRPRKSLNQVIGYRLERGQG